MNNKQDSGQGKRGRVSWFLTTKDRRRSITLTPLGERILIATAGRLGRSGSDVVEQMLREFAAKVTFDAMST